MRLPERAAPFLDGWRRLIDPSHPVVKTILARHPATISPELSTVVACFRHYRWVGTAGREDYATLLETGQGNCLTLASLLCSALAAVGIGPAYVLLAGGGLLNKALVAVENGTGILTAHAWTVVTRADQLPAIVDPVTMTVEVIPNGASLTARLILAAPVDRIWSFVFNGAEVHLYADPQACFAFLSAPGASELVEE